MKFPIEAAIEPETYGKLSGNCLRIDGNAGQIPPAFQFAILQKTLTKEKIAATDTSRAKTIEVPSYALCAQGVSAMTDEQWAEWTDQPDEPTILAAVAANEGLKLIA